MAKKGYEKTELDWQRLDDVLSFGARLLDCSEILGWSEDKIERDIKEKFGCTFGDYRKKKMAKLRQAVLQKQYEVAMAGNVAMLIWLGKQWLEQSEKVEDTTPESSKRLVIVMKNDEQK